MLEPVVGPAYFRGRGRPGLRDLDGLEPARHDPWAEILTHAQTLTGAMREAIEG